MINVVRYSQIVGLVTVDSSTSSRLGAVEEVWLDDSGRIAYLSGVTGYLPLEQVARIGTSAVSTYGHLVVNAPMELYRLHRLAVRSPAGEPLGWVEDYLFDWHTGEIVAYILAGAIADAFGERAVLLPGDVQAIAAETVIIREDAKARLSSEADGLKGFLSEKSHQVRHLVQVIGDRLHDLIAPHDRPEAVRVKIKMVSDELTSSGEHDRHVLQEATDFLHEQWHHLQQSISRASSRAKVALDSAWQHFTGKA
ncbi:PRC-barrel domain-containing protein [Pseudanabaena sp. PCC 6802]|uniref:PRC-barrel domain-containing protein n=1 Tax=Pseudanabaena sp. PCC 6802 TaxID=118173 RepID=UPI00034DA65A|nr:PRC-barrel domain-containing protein [Pseudanabaena sp. PCC 6802]